MVKLKPRKKGHIKKEKTITTFTYIDIRCFRETGRNKWYVEGGIMVALVTLSLVQICPNRSYV